MKKNLLQCIALLLLCVPYVHAKIYYANSVTGNDSNTGLNAPLALKSFHATYLKIQNGDTIMCSGVFDWTNSDEKGDIYNKGYVLNKNVTIIGDPVNKTIFQAAPVEKFTDRGVLNISMYLIVRLENLIIRNGYMRYGGAKGAGVYNSSYAYLKMKNCIVEHNHITSTYGFNKAAGIHTDYLYGYDTRTTLDLESVIVRYNSTTLMDGYNNYYFVSGAGVSAIRSKVIMKNCTVHDNYALHMGAALSTVESTLQITNCTFCNNTSQQENITILNDQRHSFFLNCTFAYNKSISPNPQKKAFASITQLNGDTFFISMRNNVFYKNINLETDNDDLYFYVASDFKNKMEWKNNYFQNGFSFNDKNHQPDNSFYFSPEANGNIIGKQDSVKLSDQLTLNNSPDGIPGFEILPGSILIDKGNNENQTDTYTSEIFSRVIKDQSKKDRIGQPDLGALEYYPTVKLNQHNKQQVLSENNHQFNDLTLENTSKISLEESDSIFIQNGLIIQGNDSSVAEISNFKQMKFKNTPKIIYTFKFKKGGWQFFSLPFSIPADKIFKNGQYYPASWGDPINYVPGSDFYIAAYNGQRRAALNTSSGNWENVTERIINAGQGYIIAVDSDIELSFVAENINPSKINDFKNLPGKIYDSDCTYFNSGWNFMGNPLTSSTNISPQILKNVVYAFNGYNYETYVEDEIFNLKPLNAFLFQASSNDSLNFISALNANSQVQSVPAIKRSSSIIKISLTDGKFPDILKIKKSENATSGFDRGVDAFKLKPINKNVPCIYTRTDNTEFSYNQIPMEMNELELIVLAPDTSKYTISKTDNEFSDFNILLADSTGNILTNLSTNYFSFYSYGNKGEIKFKLVFDELNQMIERFPDNLKIIQNADNVLITSENENDILEISDISGVQMQKPIPIKNQSSFHFPNKGIYILKFYRQNDIFSKKLIF